MNRPLNRRMLNFRSASLGLLALVSIAPPQLGCSSVSVMRGEIQGLSDVAEQAERNGALRCAPRELALAKSNLTFATVELDQGSMFRAQEHLDIAQANVHAAYNLSPPDKCAEREFVVEPLPGDRDGDGYPDPQDKCPDEPENYQGFEDGDGCPDDPDTDGDGIPDSADSCVLVPEDPDGYLDTDGCPELDNDADGVPDDRDRAKDGTSCAMDPEDPDGVEDEDGCPESLVVVTDKEIKITQQIHFEFDRDKIRPESFPILDAVVEVLEKNPKIELEIQGHTDNKGSAPYNKQLSDRRAASVLKYLVASGISPDRLKSKGYGLERPIVPNTTDENRALNRRVQFVRVESQ